MGHTSKSTPKRGSKQFWPRKRAVRSHNRIRTWAMNTDLKPSGFAGYKAGMTHVIIVDNKPKSPTKGEEIRVPVTIIECPALNVAGFRLNSSSQVLTDVLSDSLDSELAKKLKLPKKGKQQEHLKKAESLKEKAKQISLLVYTQPKLTGIGKKKPEVFEIAIGGDDINAQFDYAKEKLGKSISVDEVFSAGSYTDVHAVTKGKGFQGVIKRFGVKLRHHKSEKGRRRIGTLGPWTPKKTSWWVPQAGQMGYHTRTEYNKQIMKIGNPTEENVTPQGGLLHYGKVKNTYMLITGSVAGSKKRLIKFTKPIRNHPAEQAPNIVSISLRSQQ